MAAKPPDARTLAAALVRANRRRHLTAFLLVAPLLVFLIFTFVLPIFDMLRRAVDDRELTSVWPETASILRTWDGRNDPPETVYDAVGRDLLASSQSGLTAIAARRINYDETGARTPIMKTARAAAKLDGPPPEGWRQFLVSVDPIWADRSFWIATARASGPLTDFYVLNALDLSKADDGSIVSVEEDRAVYRTVLARTFVISFTVTVITAILGFPLAVLITTSGKRVAWLLTLFVLLPFWTSLLVRTAAWIVLLQEQGIINQILTWTGLIDDPLRLVYNRTGVLIAMVHVLLPFMVLPLVAVMRNIKPETLRAARSLGAAPFTAFRRIYLPQTYPGVAAGMLLVFISSIGYYITPALVGGADDQMLSFLIAYYTNESANWGLAAALGLLLLTSTAILSLIYARVASPRTAS